MGLGNIIKLFNWPQKISALLVLISIASIGNTVLSSDNEKEAGKFFMACTFLLTSTGFFIGSFTETERKQSLCLEDMKVLNQTIRDLENRLETANQFAGHYELKAMEISREIERIKTGYECQLREKASDIINTKNWADSYAVSVDEKYLADREQLIAKYVAEKRIDDEDRAIRFKKFRSKVLEKIKELMDEKTLLERLLRDTRTSQKETVELLEEYIKSSEKWKAEANLEYKKMQFDLQSQLKEYQFRLANAPKALLFNGADRASINGNRLIELLQSKGLVVNASKCESAKTKDTIWLQPINCLPSAVESLAELIQIVFELDKTPSISPDSGLIKVVLLVEEGTTVFDIYRYCKHFSELETLISKWERIKIDGGSESGKSPLADNLIGLKHLQGHCNVILSNPLSGSKKDYWKIPSKYRNYNEAHTGLNDCKNEIRSRALIARHHKELNLDYRKNSFNLWVFDEIDSTLSNKESKENLKEILKTGSHYDVGLIFIGQSPYCSDVGLKQADFANCVQIHIGVVIPKAVELSSYSQELKNRLLENYQKISKYYSEENRRIENQVNKFRFALVDDGLSEPFYIELPPLDHYTLSLNAAENVAETDENVAESRAETAEKSAEDLSLSAPSKTVLVVNPQNPQLSAENYPMCPQCKSVDVKRHSKRQKGFQYRCMNEECSKKYFTIIN